MEICDECGKAIENEKDKELLFLDDDNQYYHKICYEKVFEKYLNS